MSETPSPSLHAPHSAPSPPLGPHRVKGWELEAGHGPFQKELLWRGEGQAQVEGKLGARAHVRLSSGWAGGGRGLGRAGLTRRSAQEKSFFLRPGAQLAGRPAASGTHGRIQTRLHQEPWGRGSPAHLHQPCGPTHFPTPRPLPPTKTLSPMEMGTPSLAWGGTGDRRQAVRNLFTHLPPPQSTNGSCRDAQLGLCPT